MSDAGNSQQQQQLLRRRVVISIIRHLQRQAAAAAHQSLTHSVLYLQPVVELCVGHGNSGFPFFPMEIYKVQDGIWLAQSMRMTIKISSKGNGNENENLGMVLLYILVVAW